MRRGNIVQQRPRPGKDFDQLNKSFPTCVSPRRWRRRPAPFCSVWYNLAEDLRPLPFYCKIGRAIPINYVSIFAFILRKCRLLAEIGRRVDRRQGSGRARCARVDLVSVLGLMEGRLISWRPPLSFAQIPNPNRAVVGLESPRSAWESARARWTFLSPARCQPRFAGGFPQGGGVSFIRPGRGLACSPG